MKALALGARACLIGRPVIYGLAADGRAGARHVMKCMLADLVIVYISERLPHGALTARPSAQDMKLGLCGLESCQELKRDILRRQSGSVPHSAASN